MKLRATALACIALTSVLAACGGGGDGPAGGTTITPGTTVTFTEAPMAAISVKAGTVFDLRAVANSYSTKLKDLSWRVVPDKPSHPPLTLTNADCSGSSRTTTPLLDSSSTRWACATSGLAPLVNATSNYRIQVTGEDTAGNLATRETIITVAPLTETDLQVLRPTVAGSSDVTGQAGGQLNTVCFGKEQSGGANKVTYDWSVISNNSGRVFTIADAQSPTATINLPALGVGDRDATAVVRCTVTDSNGYTNHLDTTVRATAVFAAPPIVIAPDNILATVGQSHTLSCKGAGGFVIDAKEGLNYQWVLKSNPDKLGIMMSGDKSANLISYLTTLPGGKQSSEVVFQCRVTDDALRVAMVDVKVTYVENAAAQGLIQANAGSSQIVKGNTVVTLDGSGSKVAGSGTPPTAPSLFYQWIQVDGPTVSLSNANSDKPTFISPKVTDAPVTLTFKVLVTSNPVDADYEPKPNEVATVEVLVGGFNPPTLSVGPTLEVDEGTPVSFTATATAETEGTLFYRWTQVEGESVEFTGQGSKTISFDAPEGKTVFRVEVSQDPSFLSMSTSSADAVVIGEELN